VTFLSFAALLLLSTTQHADAGIIDAILRRGGKDQKQQQDLQQQADGTKKSNNDTNAPSSSIFEMTLLSNHVEFPLVGAGVGNLEEDDIAAIVQEGIKSNYHLFDTSHHRANNEELVAKGILAGVNDDSSASSSKTTIHVITKVWYTHLGYDRTKHSVLESLQALQPVHEHLNVDLKVHVLLHWPRCYDSVAWMDCQAEEDGLPSSVRQLGPSPIGNPDAWKESWQALEDMYTLGSSSIDNKKNNNDLTIASIGISNFHWTTFQELLEMARIPPHLFQMNIDDVFHHPTMVAYCEQHAIHVQLYNIFQGLHWNDLHPKVRYDLRQFIRGIDANNIDPSQLVLQYFIQHDISVLPRASTIQRLHQNAPSQQKQQLSEQQLEIIGTIMHQQLVLTSTTSHYNDITIEPYIAVTFVNSQEKELILTFYPNEEQELPLIILKPGEMYTDYSYPNHKYRLYDGDNTDYYKEFTVSDDGDDNRFEY